MGVIIEGQSQTGTYVGAGADGDILAISNSGFRPTFRFLAQDYTPYATATDALTLTGKAGTVCRVTRITVGGTATAASIYDLYLYKRSTANTGGTSTNPTPVQADSSDPAANGTLTLYTAAPTLGTGQAFEGTRLYLAAGSGSGNANTTKEYTWSTRTEKAPVIRAGETLSIGFNGQAVPTGASLYISIEWTEDQM